MDRRQCGICALFVPNNWQHRHRYWHWATERHADIPWYAENKIPFW